MVICLFEVSTLPLEKSSQIQKRRNPCVFTDESPLPWHQNLPGGRLQSDWNSGTATRVETEQATDVECGDALNVLSV